MTRVATLFALIVFVLACSRRGPAKTDPTPIAVDPVAPLRAFEQARRSQTRFERVPASNHALGADPFAIAPLGPSRFVGILRGDDRVAVLDADDARATVIDETETPRSPTAITVDERGEIFVTSELEPRIARYRWTGAALERRADIELDGVVGARDIVALSGVLYVVEEHDGRLLVVHLSPDGRASIGATRATFPGPSRLAYAAHTLFVASVLGHEILAFPLDARGVPSAEAIRTSIDGPFFGIAALATSHDEVMVVAGGVEDHPLDRRGGFFGWIDSFVYAYRWSSTARTLTRHLALNVGEHGLIVPKAISLTRGRDGASVEAFVTSYGGSRALHASIPRDEGPPTIEAIAFPPGANAIASGASRLVAANPLLDAWVVYEPGRSPLVSTIEDCGSGGRPRPLRSAVDAGSCSPRDVRERLGEALFFTGLMAPDGSSEAERSRFSCETCHFEGYVDGRVHHTGRGDVHATTKPLVGLFNNRPHFSRALDPDLSAVAENEFRVAGAPASRDPHFDLRLDDAPWLSSLGFRAGDRYDALELRRALMAFLMRLSHRTNPRAMNAAHLDSRQDQGLRLFADRCESCHEARLSTDDPSSRSSREQWAAQIVGGNSPFVWASDRYEKTGIEPYVHERGARVPSLRRLYKKRPYFTNGSAKSVRDVLDRVRFGASLTHAGGEGDRLTEEQIDALEAFLDLL